MQITWKWENPNHLQVNLLKGQHQDQAILSNKITKTQENAIYPKSIILMVYLMQLLKTLKVIQKP